jgi:competence protein ComEC
LGFIPILLGLIWAPNKQKPDVIISRDGTTIAVRGTDGRLSAVAVRGGMFELARWLEYDGDTRPAKDVAAAQSFRCDALGCVAHVGGHEIAVLAGAAALRDHCGSASVIVARFLAARLCERSGFTQAVRPIIIDQDRSRAGTGHVLNLTAQGVMVETVEEARGDRPWSRSGVAAFSQRPREPPATNVPFAATPIDTGPDADDDSPGARSGFP